MVKDVWCYNPQSVMNSGLIRIPIASYGKIDGQRAFSLIVNGLAMDAHAPCSPCSPCSPCVFTNTLVVVSIENSYI
jgi:hypothetical protein